MREKYLKAFLEEHEIEFPRSHPLLPLLDLCRSVDPSFVDLRNDLTGLDNYAVAVRYPGVAVTLKMANAALAAMVHVRAFVRGKLGLN